MTSITIHNLDKEIMSKIHANAMEHGHSVEEEVRQMLSSALANSTDTPTQNSSVQGGSETENWMDQMEELGVLDRAKNRNRDFTPGERDPGMLKAFFSERHG